ncbi:MAG TPA: lamin tail domain-containing protein [Verrucomicrobiae bacterium]|nr:lamin tail domain-containing protein [Verrucomicrobiae bacterium]
MKHLEAKRRATTQRHRPLLPAAFFVALALLVTLPPAHAQLEITEFMAVNNTSLKDEDGANSDWIELHNFGPEPVNLAGWSLTDSTNNLIKWQFPATNLAANGYLIVFASEKNRRVPGAPLHTNFKLSGEGEYLALVAPDGVSVATEFAPTFPVQVADVSYGRVRDFAPLTLVATGAVVHALVPTGPELGSSWIEVNFDDESWLSGTGGVGYDRQPVGVDFLPLIGLNVETQMYNVNGSVYIRLPFTLTELPELDSLTVRMKFEDGFVAYLNGVEVARSNAPATLTWNATATTPRTDTAATNFADFDLTSDRDLLHLGENVLAFQALNNPTNSPDLLLLSQLVASTPLGAPVARYFPSPTPGQANHDGVEVLGPIIRELQHSPVVPRDNQDIIVTATLRPAFGPVASATLQYRVMFGPEVSVPLLDDGAHSDGAANDGVFGATIPASASAPGQMVRWYVLARDTDGRISRFPPFTSTNNSPAYLGTVVVNPTLTNALPVFHWFVQNAAAADTSGGTRASVFFAGEFYDNVFNRVRGASAPTFPKKPYKFDFNPGAHFRYRADAARVEEINLNATYQDKALVRQTLTYESYQDSGVPASDCFSVRVERNGSFYSVALLTEQVDETFLEKRGLDPAGALYKLFNGINSATSGVEKKTRRTENNSDLQQLVNGISPTNPKRGTNLFDLLDLPEIINYLAAGVVSQDWDRAIKNIYLYRDSAGSQLWQTFPWDKDLSFGKVGLVNDDVTAIKDATTGASGEPYISHPYYGQTGRNCCGVNNLFDAVYATPVTREMFLRRLRTLMDELLQPPGTPAGQLKYEAKLDRLYPLHQADAALDLSRWGAGYGAVQTLATAISILRTNYLVARRPHLYLTHSAAAVSTNRNAVGIPDAQNGTPPLTFGDIDFNPASGDQRQEYVELINSNTVAVDVSGWRIDGGIQFTFAPGTVIPSGRRLYLSPDVVAFKQRSLNPHGGQGLLVVGNYQGQLSARGESLRLFNRAGTNVATLTYPGAPSPAQQALRITEIMYHPAPPVPGDTNSPENFEYVELKNISAVPLDLTGVRFVGGIEFEFSGSAVTTLGPGAAVLVVKQPAAFVARYGAGRPIAGSYQGALENSGERIQLLDARNEEIHDFRYNNTWYPVTDGLGFSLVVVNELADPDRWGDRTNWRPSGLPNGTPGTTDPGLPATVPVVVNEVLSNTDPPSVDAIELHNPTDGVADVGGWFITDDTATPRKFRIPDGTLIPAGGFVVFTEANFNAIPRAPGSFAFSSDGDEAFLFSATAAGQLTGYSHGFRFGAAATGVSFGRHLTSIGEEHFVGQSTSTLGSTNAGPKVGPVVISEIHYHPPCAPAGIPCEGDEEPGLEYIELQNISVESVVLEDAAGNPWRLRAGVEFEFPANFSLKSGEIVLVVGFDPSASGSAAAAFRGVYGLNPAVTLLGPYRGRLDNTDDRLELQKPEPPPVSGNGAVPYVLIDAVHYRDGPPWPVRADGQGASLQRTPLNAYGDDPASWIAADPSPGFPLPAGLSWATPHIVRWPLYLAGYELQSTPTLGAGSWITDASTRSTNGNFVEVFVPRTGSSRFYRLIKR